MDVDGFFFEKVPHPEGVLWAGRRAGHFWTRWAVLLAHPPPAPEMAIFKKGNIYFVVRVFKTEPLQGVPAMGRHPMAQNAPMPDLNIKFPQFCGIHRNSLKSFCINLGAAVVLLWWVTLWCHSMVLFWKQGRPQWLMRTQAIYTAIMQNSKLYHRSCRKPLHCRRYFYCSFALSMLIEELRNQRIRDSLGKGWDQAFASWRRGSKFPDPVLVWVLSPLATDHP